MSGTRKRASTRREQVSLADRLTIPGHPDPTDGSLLPDHAQPHPSRQATRRHRKEQARRRWAFTLLGVAVVAALVLGLLGAWWLTRDDKTTTDELVVGRTQRTLVMTLAAPGEAATSGALLATDTDSGTAGGVLIQSRVFVEGPAPEGVPFGETVLLPAASAPGDGIADTLNVLVDETWQVTPAALSSMVDAVGGVLVDVDVDILGTSKSGQSVLVLAAGDAQQLTGSQAAAFAQYLGKQEAEESRLARLGQVLEQLTQSLPEQETELAPIVAAAVAASTTTADEQTLSSFLLSFGDAVRAGEVGFQALTVSLLETGGPAPAAVADPEGIDRLRGGLLAGSLPADASGTAIRVLVENGVGTPLLEQSAAKLLQADGYDFDNGGNASSFDFEQTRVLIPDATPASLELGNAVAETLGVPQSAVQITDQGTSVADVIVILGADFQP